MRVETAQMNPAFLLVTYNNPRIICDPLRTVKEKSTTGSAWGTADVDGELTGSLWAADKPKAMDRISTRLHGNRAATAARPERRRHRYCRAAA